MIKKISALLLALMMVLAIGTTAFAAGGNMNGEAGVVGEEEGTKPRQVLMSAAQFEEYLRNNG